MPTLHEEATQASERLLRADEPQLYEELAMRLKAIQAEPSAAGQFDLHPTYEEAAMGPKDELRELGRRLWQRWQVETYNLFCGSSTGDAKDRRQLIDAIGVGEVAVAGALASLLVAHLAMAPAIATVIAALVVKRFFRPGYEELCAYWSKQLPAVGSS
ncbi:MAG TPA: hypothetical protein VFS60_19195 [Thermoanaerobaculia bacterium]|nr:hypothetical protein [Thermoanaerobaculia bacterium]